MPLRFCDSHVHVEDADGESGYHALINRAAAADVARLVAIGGSEALNTGALHAARDHQQHVRAAVGYDRDCCADIDHQYTAMASTLRQQAAHPGVVAIGETGLDYHYTPDTAKAQQRLLSLNLEVAAERDLPVVVHSREADADTVAMLKEHASLRTEPFGVLHCFTGSECFARQLLDIGLYISFSGIVTFRSADRLRAVAAMVPADRYLIETDTPYLAPVPLRGKPNEPAFVTHVAAGVAAARGVDVALVASQTFDNAARLFNWF